MSERTIGCEEALRLLAAHLDREVTDRDDIDVVRHLEICRSCYSRAEFERALRARLAELGRRDPEPVFAQRIRDLVGEFTRAAKPQALGGDADSWS